MKLISNQKDIGFRLQKARRSIDRTQEDLSKMSGIPKSTISQMEAGTRRLHSFYLSLLADKFNINLHWVFTGIGSMSMPALEINWDFGKDTGLILKIISLIEKSPESRYEILAYFLEFLNKHEERIKEQIPGWNDTGC